MVYSMIPAVDCVVCGGVLHGSCWFTLWFVVLYSVVRGGLLRGSGGLLHGSWWFTLWFMVVFYVVCGGLLHGS